MNKAVLTSGVVVIIAILCVAGYLAYTTWWPKPTPGPPGPGQTGSNSGTGVGGSVNGVTSGDDALVWQTLWINNVNGKSYWYNAPEAFQLSVLSGSQSGSGTDFEQVSTFQNNIYINVNSTTIPSVSSWSFSATEDVTIQSTSGQILCDITTAGMQSGTSGPTTVTNVNSQPPTPGQNVWVTGATFSASSFLSTPGVSSLPAGNYYFVITLSNIVLTLNGQTYTVTQGNQNNILAWLINIGNGGGIGGGHNQPLG